ncbi:MAG TPA: class I SAM-dependent methyltransferase [Pyrinomonadaceae bacterium]|nr:class I SAM-dependent methyltransferase [Pyrinomonadaceae bacterium]
MSSEREKENLYERAGISDLAHFYRTRFVSDELLDARYFDALNRFDIRWARTLWVYDNVRRNSRVLDLGCGGGVLALLKRKSVTLIGVDISDACASRSHANGYDAAYVARLTALPFPDNSFDYVVSLDVMGHVEFAEKDAVLAEVRRVLRPNGVTLHGIESMNRDWQKDYHEMSEDELRRFVQVDGHVGMEDEASIAARFQKFFGHVRTEPRFGVCLPSDVMTKLTDEYGMQVCDPDFLDYLRSLSFKERRAFNMAMGYVFGKISEQGIRMPQSGYTFVKASAQPLGSFYNEQMDRANLFPSAIIASGHQSVCLDRSTHAAFDSGWHEAANFPPVARWMSERARVRFRSAKVRRLSFDLTTHMPDLYERPLGLEIFLNGERVLWLSIVRAGWQELWLDVPAESADSAVADYELEIRADRTWQPSLNDDDSNDDRELSVAICNIELIF